MRGITFRNIPNSLFHLKAPLTFIFFLKILVLFIFNFSILYFFLLREMHGAVYQNSAHFLTKKSVLNLNL